MKACLGEGARERLMQLRKRDKQCADAKTPCTRIAWQHKHASAAERARKSEQSRKRDKRSADARTARTGAAEQQKARQRCRQAVAEGAWEWSWEGDFVILFFPKLAFSGFQKN